MKTSPFSNLETLLRSLRHYFAHFSVFMSLSLCGSSLALIEIFMGFFWPDFVKSSSLMLLPASFSIHVLFLMALIEAVKCSFEGEDFMFGGVVLSAWRRIWRGLCANVLYYLIIVLGLLLLIVPAFYWMTIFAFFLFTLVLEDLSPWAAFRRSKELVSGEFWKVFKSLSFILAVLLAVSLPFIVGSLLLWAPVLYKQVFIACFGVFVSPVVICFFYLLFDHLRRNKDGRLKIHESLAPRYSP